jgi:hypothetical protein
MRIAARCCLNAGLPRRQLQAAPGSPLFAGKECDRPLEQSFFRDQRSVEPSTYPNPLGPLQENEGSPSALPYSPLPPLPLRSAFNGARPLFRCGCLCKFRALSFAGFFDDKNRTGRANEVSFPRRFRERYGLATRNYVMT